MTNWYFFVPYGYFIRTRIKSSAARISWVLIYFVPLLLTTFAFKGELVWADVFYLMLAATAVYAVYELGYIDNDTTTVQKELEPTIRLDAAQTQYVFAFKWVISITRLSLTLILLGLCFSAPGFSWLFIGLLSLLPTFSIYNRVRGRANAFIHPILVSIRFCLPVLLLLPEEQVLWYLILLFPVLNSLERASEPRYGLTFLQNFVIVNQTSGRWLYYLLVMLGLTIYLPFADQSPALLLPMAYMFSYRLVTSWLRPHKVVS